MTADDLKKKELKRLKRKRAALNKKKRWIEAKVNTHIYIQGLPKDITEEELKEYFSRAGAIRINPQTA